VMHLWRRFFFAFSHGPSHPAWQNFTGLRSHLGNAHLQPQLHLFQTALELSGSRAREYAADTGGAPAPWWPHFIARKPCMPQEWKTLAETAMQKVKTALNTTLPKAAHMETHCVQSIIRRRMGDANLLQVCQLLFYDYACLGLPLPKPCAAHIDRLTHDARVY
ncbi:hypothetical protein CYMTET_32790, partial [Cymbomonas tetramitiformis]